VKVIIAGSRSITQLYVLDEAIAHAGFDITEVVYGGAAGVDTLASFWARKHNIPQREFPAAWREHGKAAGTIRNGMMAQCVGPEGGLIAIQFGWSPGTADMIQQARKTGMRVFVMADEKIPYERGYRWRVERYNWPPATPPPAPPA
jgi:hypothetical protein